MGKASTAKKVQRAARAGGKTAGRQRQFGFPLAIGLVVVLGLSLVVYSRQSGQLASDKKNHPQVGEHWHASYGIFICDHFVTNVADRAPDTLGIHTHQDGLVHIHPFVTSAAGLQADFQKFFDQTGLSVKSGEIKLPAAAPFKGRTYKVGSTTCNGKPAKVEMVKWTSAVGAATGAKPSKTYTSNFGKVHFAEDLAAYTIAFVPAGTKVPPPPGAGDILNLSQADASPAPSSSSSSDTTPNTVVATVPNTGGGASPGATTPVTAKP